MKYVTHILLLGFLTLAGTVSAQTEPEDIALAQNQFQDAFYESLKQKGIENYDKALESLESCLKLEPKNATVLFEMGKNYLALKQYPKAYEFFERATQIDPKNKWYWVGLYDVCYETRNWEQAIVIVNKLITFKTEYREDLVSLYMNTQQFDKALALINELNDKVGKSDMRENYKAQILRDAKFQGAEEQNLLAGIKKNPKDEANYIALIYLYSEANQEDKAVQIAKQLEKEIPGSDFAQVSLFKEHLNSNNGAAAVKAMNAALSSNKVDQKIKHRILNEFLIYVKTHPEHEPDLDKAIGYFRDDHDVAVAKEIGKFYHGKKDWAKAVKYYEMHLVSHADDLDASMLLLQAYAENNQYEALSKKSEALVELYPLQPQFYYYAGLGYNQQKNYKKAKDLLEMGVDYVVNDTALEANFNIQLGEAFNGLGDMKKKETYFLKAERLLKQK